MEERGADNTHYSFQLHPEFSFAEAIIRLTDYVLPEHTEAGIDNKVVNLLSFKNC